MNPIAYLKSIATVEACRANYEFAIEHSDRSEAVYVKVWREGFWRGVRIAAHVPHYPCSGDYEQVLVPASIDSVDEIAEQEQLLIAAVRSGRMVIADPLEVDEAMFQAWRQKRHGVCQSGPRRTRFRWDESSDCWMLSRIGDRLPTDDEMLAFAAEAPTNSPVVRLTPREQSAVRHRLNHRARWIYDETAAYERAEDCLLSAA